MSNLDILTILNKKSDSITILTFDGDSIIKIQSISTRIPLLVKYTNYI
ncbi:hypothetical protein BCG9842_A0063 (plasmid) [Bacillus cereus G9842]|uniref:Uncharacterized protein n=1 Tax=Bacillus cereus (strain G9842) TaxID=405531 RepID=B7IZQ6_BACC2|nr:hypothetical protein BCG9842_A0063 [Bacillus cereus G9842]